MLQAHIQNCYKRSSNICLPATTALRKGVIMGGINYFPLSYHKSYTQSRIFSNFSHYTMSYQKQPYSQQSLFYSPTGDLPQRFFVFLFNRSIPWKKLVFQSDIFQCQVANAWYVICTNQNMSGNTFSTERIGYTSQIKKAYQLNPSQGSSIVMCLYVNFLF